VFQTARSYLACRSLRGWDGLNHAAMATLYISPLNQISGSDYILKRRRLGLGAIASSFI
jgi:hypothetical protein